GYVVKDPSTAHYSIGARLLGYGLRAGGNATLIQAAHPLLEWLSEQLGETANLGVLNGYKVQYIDIVESPHDLRMAARTGVRDELHSTSLGKAMLAFLPETDLDHLLQSSLRSKTPRTITNANQLREELAIVRQTGIASEDGENELA